MSLNASGLSICFKDSSQSGFSGEAQLRLISRDRVAFVRKSQTVSWKMVKQIRTVFEAIFKGGGGCRHFLSWIFVIATLFQVLRTDQHRYTEIKSARHYLLPSRSFVRNRARSRSPGSGASVRRLRSETRTIETFIA